MKQFVSEKDVTLQTYGGRHNRVETLLQVPAESDDGPEGEDILGGPFWGTICGSYECFDLYIGHTVIWIYV
jgi:hypothetical protein